MQLQAGGNYLRRLRVHKDAIHNLLGVPERTRKTDAVVKALHRIMACLIIFLTPVRSYASQIKWASCECNTIRR